MKIPFLTYLPLMLLAVGITWYLRTKDMNFIPDSSVAPSPPSTVDKTSLVGPPAPETLVLDSLKDDLIVARIDHYNEYLDRPEELIHLYTAHKADQQIEKAYLAGERIMEHPEISLNQKRDYAAQLSKLAELLPAYTVDLSEVKELTVNFVGVPLDIHETISVELRDLVDLSSGGLVALKLNFTEGDEPSINVGDKGFSPLPIASDREEIISRFYALLVTTMNKNGGQLPLWRDATAQEFIASLTRHHWHLLFNSTVEATVVQPNPEDAPAISVQPKIAIKVEPVAPTAIKVEPATPPAIKVQPSTAPPSP